MNRAQRRAAQKSNKNGKKCRERFCNHLYTDNEENVDFVLKVQIFKFLLFKIFYLWR